MNGSFSAIYSFGAFAVFVVLFLVVRKVFMKAKLPPSPAFGPMPVPELAKYYTLRDAPIAWEKVKGWQVNERPPNLGAPAPIDHIVLMPRLLEFCTGASGRMTLVFNFLVQAIEHVDFDPNAVPPGTAPPGTGLLTIHTPSGQTLLIASSNFAQALRQATGR